MKKTVPIIATLIAVLFPLSAGAVTPFPRSLIAGLGDLHHPVATRNAEAQRYFDQGVELVYAFNHEEAAHSFRRAAELDPKMAMAHWGIAWALGPNYNQPVDAAREAAAFKEIQVALKLAKDGPENERAYIEALARRFSGDPKADLNKLAVEYR